LWQSLEFAALPEQFSDAVLLLRNAGTILLDVSLESQQHADLFVITPAQCQLEPGGTAEIHVRFLAPDARTEPVYERFVRPSILP